MPEYYGPDIITTLAKRLRPFLLSVAEGAVQANEWDNIIRIIDDGGGWQIYDVTAAGLTSALSDAGSGDMIWMPPCSLTGDFTVPANVHLVSMGYNAVIDGQITLADAESSIVGMVINHTESSSGDLYGVVCANDSGISRIYTDGVYITNTGSGTAFAVKQTGAGSVYIWNSNLNGDSTGSGDGYAVDPGTGEIFIEGGYVRGSTDEFNNAGTGSAWSAGAEISTGAFSVTDSSGTVISGLTPGNKYAIEAYNGPWNRGGGYDDEYDFKVSEDGILFSGRLGRFVDGQMYLVYPAWVGYAETLNTDYARAYFVASGTSIYIRVGEDSLWGDNTGSLSWRLRSATFTEGDNPVKVHAVRGGEDGVPVIGDRSVWDVIDYDAYHTNEIDQDTFIRHLPAPSQAGNIAWDDGDEWISKSFIDAIGAAGIETNPPSGIDYVSGPRATTIANDAIESNYQNVLWNRLNAISSFNINGKEYQTIIYWNSSGELVIGVRVIPECWTFYTYDGTGGLPSISITGDDSHDDCTLGIDPDGYLHVCYDMHDDALNYRMSDAPLDSWTGDLTDELSMLGTNESAVSYPLFFNDPNNVLYFLFRDGVAGNGDTYMYQYNTTSGSWSAVAGTTAGLLIDGKNSTRSAYASNPIFDNNFGDGGYFHLFFFWTQSSANTRYDLAYARWDGTNWTQIDDTSQTVPITPANDDVADPISSGTYLSSYTSAVDACGYPHAVYGYQGADTYHNVYHIWYNGSSWVKLQITNTTNDPTDSLENIIPTIVIDRDSNTAYILAEISEVQDGITMYTSDPGDYTVWTESRIYTEDVGYTLVFFDPYQWREHKRLHIALFPFPDGDSNYPIILLEYTPSGFALFNATDFSDLHANDIDTALGIHHTLGTGANQSAAGNHSHSTRWEPLTNGNGSSPALVYLDGDVIMVEENI